MLGLGKTLIVYFSSSENKKIHNEDKTVLELEKLFLEKNYTVNLISLESKKGLKLQDK